jgi:hypothetical protein
MRPGREGTGNAIPSGPVRPGISSFNDAWPPKARECATYLSLVQRTITCLNEARARGPRSVRQLRSQSAFFAWLR